VVLAAEQEIATAAKQARRELSTHTAGLAIALARQQIQRRFQYRPGTGPYFCLETGLEQRP
jgi:F0F1-type ATP synthase membrane subunit b/b'